MDSPLEDSTEFEFDKELDLQNQELPFSSLKVFYYNHPPPSPGIEDIPYSRICHALSATKFYGQLVFAKFWAAIDFGTGIVLTARGQPFGFSMYTNEFWSHRTACLDRNSYVHPENQVSVRLPGDVFLDRTTKWTQYASVYNDNLYPQQEDAWIFFMPVIEADRCFGVLEISMTNDLLSDTCSYQVLEVCIALKEQGLQSSHKIENITVATSEDRPSKRPRVRASKSDHITLHDITKFFGRPKKVAAEYFGLSKNTFGDVHRRHRIDDWPCKRIVKSSAHHALIREAPSKCTTSNEDNKQLKDLEYWLMQDNGTEIICDDVVNLVDDQHMDNMVDYLMSNEDKTIDDECLQPVLLELYR